MFTEQLLTISAPLPQSACAVLLETGLQLSRIPELYYRPLRCHHLAQLAAQNFINRLSILAAELIPAPVHELPGSLLHIIHHKADVGYPLSFLVGS